MIESLGQRLLEGQPNAIVKYRLLRDVICLPPGSSELADARSQMHSHAWVQELAREQQPDGNWGRFHSMDSSIKTRFPTSEMAIRRALALGLDKDDLILGRAVDFMTGVLEKKTAWSDRAEKSEGWPIGVEAITAGTLAQVDPSHPATLAVWEYWVGIALRAFPNGIYEPSAEWKAHQEARGIGITYLRSRYVLTLLGARSASLPADLDHLLAEWIWNNPEGIGYLGADLQHPNLFHIFNWLESLEILLRLQSGHEVATGALDWLWDQHKSDGLWDFGAKVSKSFYFPLSDDWRKAGNRSVDHSTRVLALLQAIIHLSSHNPSKTYLMTTKKEYPHALHNP
jgi:hypothetical protein